MCKGESGWGAGIEDPEELKNFRARQEEFFGKADENADGVLNYEEFKAYMKLFEDWEMEYYNHSMGYLESDKKMMWKLT